MRSAKIYRYQLPMDSGVILRDNKLVQREGWIVELMNGDEQGLGEIAPLPGFSLESTEEAGIQLESQLEKWILGEAFCYENLFPSVAFGLSMAELELTNQLPKEGLYDVAPLCTGDPDDLLPKLNQMKGKKVAKIKVGLYEPIRDGITVNLFLEFIPDLYLRLDANRVWTKEKAQKFAAYIKPHFRDRISYIEEPCPRKEDSLSFSDETGIAIAWDETVQEMVKRPQYSIDELKGANTIVIKPTLIGSVDLCIELIERASEIGVNAVLSSSLESSLGLTQLARFAKWKLPDTIPGLDTIDLFAQQLEVPWPNNGLPLTRLKEQTLVWHKSASK